jgi:hypothetical protein
MTGKEGSAMVESAIYFPIIILCVMFVVYVMIHMYSITALQAHLHLTVQREAGKQAGVTAVGLNDTDSKGVGPDTATGRDRYAASAFAKKIRVSKGGGAIAPYAEAEVGERYYGGRMARPDGVRVQMYARSYAIREVTAARLAAAAKGALR